MPWHKQHFRISHPCVIDTGGATSSGVINLASIFGQTSPSIDATGGLPTLNFGGVPGYSYSVQRSTDLLNWTTIWTTNAPTAGVFQFTDSSAPQLAAYYRLQYNP